MISISRSYGIEDPWTGSLLFFAAFAGLNVGALYAARRQHFGVSIVLSSFVVAILGFFSLLIFSGAGM